MLGMEDHGIVSCMLYMKFDGSGQGFGGYTLDEYREDLKRRIGCGWGMEFIMRTLAAVGVEKWEDLKGKYCRVRHDKPGFGGKIIAIGHIIEDRWFDAVAFSNEAHTWNEKRT
jgi:hypothetical protein